MVIEGESVKIFATIPLPTKIHERELDKTDVPGTFNARATLGPINQTKMERMWNKHKQSNNTPLKRKVFVAMSGGVDSSVAAALLHERGYAVTGVFIKAWRPEFVECPWTEDRLDAMRVCATLGIPFLTFDFGEEYKRDVADAMIRDYRAGRTPNPDVLCNTHIKFGRFLTDALERGADYIATGHYVRKGDDGEKHLLRAGADKNKDQSYFLWTLTQERLRRCLFPIGDYEKPAVREIAARFGLHTASKKDSQGVCFLGKLDMKDFLEHYIPKKRGDVRAVSGAVIGWHEGATFLTVGERHGFTITRKTPHDAPLYVVAKDMESNTITVVPQSALAETHRVCVALEKTNWISGAPDAAQTYQARGRYRAPLSSCTVSVDAPGRATISFLAPHPPLASGQSVVVYDGETCLGGGIVS